jgi:endoglucanase
VTGIFGRPAIHTRQPGKEPELEVSNLSIDVGAHNKEEVEKLGIHVGIVVTFDAKFMILNDRYYVCRALDNRMGGYMIAQVAKKLKDEGKKLDF